MGENTKIEWAHHTFNPWVGCTKVSAACDHCYAEGWAKRTGSPELWSGERRRTGHANWQKPIVWNGKAELLGIRYRVFCASLADVFDNQVPKEWRFDLFTLIRETPHLDWLLLTKRPQNIAKMLPLDWGDGWPNVWLGTTVENQVEGDRRIPILLRVPAAIRFLSYEPALGPLDLWSARYPLTPSTYVSAFNWGKGIHWVIAGGESGPNARPAHPDWFRGVRDDCIGGSAAFLFKQWGEWAPGECADGPPTRTERTAELRADGSWSFSSITPRVSEELHRDDEPDLYRVGKKRAGRSLDGVEHNGFPVEGAAA